MTEALANAAEAQGAWMVATREAGRAMPGPSLGSAEAYSGNWVLRTPRSLHRPLAEGLGQEGFA